MHLASPVVHHPLCFISSGNIFKLINRIEAAHCWIWGHNLVYLNIVPQGRKYLKDRVLNQRVFLVVENVSQNNIEEAEFYVNAGYARGSRVLVTSRTKRVLESVFRGQQYSDFCRPVPVLNAKEAALLVLTKAAPNKEITELDENEYEVVDYCCRRCFIDKQYHPSSLIALANYLRTIGDDIIAWKPQLESESFRESNESDSMYRYVLLDYDNLSNPTKLIFLDLALFSEACVIRTWISTPTWSGTNTAISQM